MSLKKIFGKNDVPTSKVLEATQTLDAQVYALRHAARLMDEKLDRFGVLAAQALLRQTTAQDRAIPFAEVEFSVFSQFGDDGIIQYVLHRLNLPANERRFVEFGVETYKEANTRFLLVNNNWSGLVLDGSEANIQVIRAEDIYWRHELTAVQSFITVENINELLRQNGATGRIGLLSVDIDGNDYWVWEKISVVDPALVIVEYNGVFGAVDPVTIPYQPDFVRNKAHFSNLYGGASLPALCHLAQQKGYRWIGCNSAGNNAYFVRENDAHLFVETVLPRDFVAARFRESRDEDGRQTFTGQAAGREALKELPVYDVVAQRIRRMGDLAF